MNILKKILSSALAVCLAGTCFASCGGTDGGNTAEGTTTAETEATKGSSADAAAASNATANPVPSSNDAGNNATIVIGCTGPLSGSAEQYGNAVKHGIQLAIRDVNESGELGDTKLTMVFEDDEADGGEKTLEAYGKLKEQGLDIMVGSVTSDSTLALVDKTKEDNIFLLTPSSSSENVTKNDNCFQVCFSDPNQGKASADYITENKLAKKVAIIHDSSTAYSIGVYDTFKAEASAKGLEIVSDTTFTKDSSTDFSAQIKDAKEAGAELVFLPVYYQEAGAILTQADAADFKPIFFGCDGLDGILSLENFNMVLANDVMLLTPFAADSDAENIRKFDLEFREYFGTEPNQFAADAYDGVMIIAELIKQEGITASMSPAEMNEKLKAAISNGFTYDGLTGSGMTWSADGSVSKEPKAVVIKDGAYVDFEKAMSAE